MFGVVFRLTLLPMHFEPPSALGTAGFSLMRPDHAAAWAFNLEFAPFSHRPFLSPAAAGTLGSMHRKINPSRSQANAHDR